MRGLLEAIVILAILGFFLWLAVAWQEPGFRGWQGLGR